MKKYLTVFLKTVGGNDNEYSLEQRIFNFTSFFLTLFAIIGGIANDAINLPFITVWTSYLGAFISVVVYWLSRFKNIFNLFSILIYLVTAFAILGVMYFYNGGINGTIIYLLIMLLNIFILITPYSYQYLVYIIIYSDFFILVMLEYFNPDWVLDYANKDQKVLDHIVTMLYSMLFTSIIINVFRKKNIEDRVEILSINQELIIANEISTQKTEHIETLLKELNHRVKNNLQLIISLINMQAATLSDSNAKMALTQASDRMLSLVLVHQKLYKTQQNEDIFMPDFLKELVENIDNSFQTGGNDNIIFNLDNINLNSEKAILIGFIVTELVTNAYKHAFTQNKQHQLQINFLKVEGTFCLQIIDNGIGFNTQAKQYNFGYQLIEKLMIQLKGKWSINSELGFGTKVEILI